MQNKASKFQEIVAREVNKALDTTTGHITDLMGTVIEKFDELRDEVDRGFQTVGEKFEAEEWETPRSSRDDMPGPSNTPRRPDKGRRLSKCPFCRRIECKDPSSCGLKLKWSSRMTIHKRDGLCADKCCYKRHPGRCNKLDKVSCTHCGRKHTVVWCVLRAKQDRLI